MIHHQVTQLLYRISLIRRSQKTSNKEDNNKTNKGTQYFEAYIQQDKVHKQKNNTYVNPLPKIMSQVQVTIGINMMKTKT